MLLSSAKIAGTIIAHGNIFILTLFNSKRSLMSDWTKEALRLCQTESGKSMMDVAAQRTIPCDARPAL